ncbi:MULTISPECIES: universal stress protein [Mycobacteriaceae]|uniref:Universal stress protein UspA n=1 Tax=Mycolicibacterium neoaurum VKM Ac-1815D TaxID=700508 RepID=V5XA13_MYCNE|nr:MULTISPECIES: universal stress protein [Mycobacteriaceae]AHC24516.1 universal stress protein UspA [Mycolicibacterium neoaurum VKM Ac-1815D]AMO05099.1 universal stress protein UspA [Mycolicibacterium neoaurum]AXK76593.1 universal stress protein [Mycolicibacterium neoaurum]KJQ52190.1 universal stress protein UspA [Mycolicibacterium neoaurum]KUM07821.1 universal stress protein UspA [Mycolicibacterium neoaurum]
MHLTVGYLATPTGDDGVALAAALARTFDADVDVVLVVREELPDGHPGRAQYQELLLEKGKQWITKAVGALTGAAKSVNANVLVGESFAEELLRFAESHSSDLIVVGGARDGFFGGHVIGPVSSALLHSSPIPVALAPRGYADDAPETIAAVTAAVPSRPGDDNPLPFAITLASAANLPIRMVSLVSAENLSEAEDLKELRAVQIAAAQENLAVAARALPDSPDIESLVADGMTLESALKKLNWDDDDLLVVGSSRFAAPKRIFLGSTASRILAGTDAPVIVIPRDE